MLCNKVLNILWSREIFNQLYLVLYVISLVSHAILHTLVTSALSEEIRNKRKYVNHVLFCIRRSSFMIYRANFTGVMLYTASATRIILADNKL